MLYSAVTARAERHTVIVLSQGDHTVYDFNPTTGRALNQIQLSGAPGDAVFGWDELTLFVSVPEAGYISVINVPTFREISRLVRPEFRRSGGTGAFVGGLATSPTGDKLYVAVDDGLLVFDPRLLVYNPEWQQPGKKIPLPGKDGQHMHSQGTTGKLYYPFRRENQVVVIDTSSDSVLKTVPVRGGPTDVTFSIGGEAWVTAADGSISIIDTSKDEVAKTIDTGGKGAGRITIAPDIRFIAASHSESGDTSILHPLTKAVVGTVKTGKGAVDVAFAPAARAVQGAGHTVMPPDFRMKDPTNQLYVTGESDVAVVDLDQMAVSARQKVGKDIAGELIHYTYAPEFSPPREGTAKMVLEADLFYVFQNAMFLYDVSPIHQHRQDMAGIFTGTGTAKLGCYDPKCPPDMIPVGEGGLPYNNLEGLAGTYTGIARGTIHQEEGSTPSPRRMISFVLKNNYYRQTNPPRKDSLFANAGFGKMQETARVWVWDVVLIPGKPVTFPSGDYAFVYLGGALMRVTHDGKPEIVNRYFNDWEYDPKAKTIEALSNRIRIAVMEFK